MLRKLMALLVSGAVVFASPDIASAAPAASAKQAKQFRTSESKKNATPLPARGAAGIQKAQGMTTGGNDWILLGGGVAVGVLILVLVAGGGDNDDSPPSTGTN